MSPAIQDVTYLRLNIPSRQPVHHLIVSNSPSMFDTRGFPNLASLDLSSCAVHVSDLPLLINRFGKQLRHLILDDTNVCNGSIVGEWEALGKAIALADVAPTRQREKLLKSWIDARSPSITAHDHGSSAVPDNQITRSKRGRKGLATPTISLRQSSDDTSNSVIIRSQPISFEGIQHLTGKIRLVPMASHIQSICINQLSSGMEESARSEFAKGWLDGLRQLHATWARLQQSQSNGTRLFRFGSSQSLTEIGPLGQDKFWDHMTLSSSFNSPPLLCFSGAIKKRTEMNEHHSLPIHPNGCGHQDSADVWPPKFYD
ncbi:hypothetical protein Clacol_007760 [Clathrus columnatus]|uniref:Uncharacterized protein n=1 Tax=Clathrus columnatus TaxID=1419009 RepID=A0AAV5AM44_9AGAM|nr:hypothetical protein Clacol_007760 [Clathrus columnatus]